MKAQSDTTPAQLLHTMRKLLADLEALRAALDETMAERDNGDI